MHGKSSLASWGFVRPALRVVFLLFRLPVVFVLHLYFFGSLFQGESRGWKAPANPAQSVRLVSVRLASTWFRIAVFWCSIWRWTKLNSYCLREFDLLQWSGVQIPLDHTWPIIPWSGGCTAFDALYNAIIIWTNKLTDQCFERDATP